MLDCTPLNTRKADTNRRGVKAGYAVIESSTLPSKRKRNTNNRNRGNEDLADA
jgi:hypothetical protein